MKDLVFKENTVYNADCFNVIKAMPDECLDLVIVDPPYGDGIGYGRKGKEILNNENESINYRFLDAIVSKMKNDTSIYVFSNHKFFSLIRDYGVSIGLKYRMVCIMVKNNIGMGHGFRNQYEVCIVFEKGNPVYNLKNMSNVWKMKHVAHDDNSHPHEKEYDIIRRIILHSSNEGDLVFDGFLGSFSSAVACVKENRRYIGSELDSKWFKTGYNRLKALEAQTTLF